MLVIPRERDRLLGALGVCGLFYECVAVPREVSLLDGGCTVDCEALFGNSSGEGVIEVAPGGAVGRDDRGEAVLCTPDVVPGIRFAGEAGFLAEGYAAERVVFVADGAGFGDAGAGVRAVASC